MYTVCHVTKTHVCEVMRSLYEHLIRALCEKGLYEGLYEGLHEGYTKGCSKSCSKGCTKGCTQFNLLFMKDLLGPAYTTTLSNPLIRPCTSLIRALYDHLVRPLFWAYRCGGTLYETVRRCQCRGFTLHEGFGQPLYKAFCCGGTLHEGCRCLF